MQGNTFGLKPSQLKRLKATYRRQVQPEQIVSPELARHLTELSRETGRQLGVLLDRRGGIEWVIVGDARKIELPDVGRARAGQSRLRGLRLVHTHLTEDPVDRDDLTDLALLRLDLVAVVHARPDGLPGHTSWAHLLPDNAGGELWRIEEARDVHQSLDFEARTQIEDLEAQFDASSRRLRAVQGVERAILVGVGAGAKGEKEANLAELRELARTAGVEVVDVVVQNRRQPDPRYLIGRGKLEELNLRAMQLMVEVVIFDQDLAPSQARAIADVTNVKILDRTQLILDIFAQRAQSNEGKIQVELAQLKYTMPRLAARDDSLSRLTGGIGGRGPGETKLEVDRRRARERVTRLEKQLEAIATSRLTRRSRRREQGVPTISIVGYTNAGKSTLLNRLTHSDVLAEDRLFATLDTATRRLRFPSEREVIITDTVGFIRDLPKDLKAAFRATLEELADADLLLHVVDAADAGHLAHIAAVEEILGELDLLDRPRLLVYNKMDKVNAEGRHVVRNGGVAVSAWKGAGMDELLSKSAALLFREGDSRKVQTALADLA